MDQTHPQQLPLLAISLVSAKHQPSTSLRYSLRPDFAVMLSIMLCLTLALPSAGGVHPLGAKLAGYCDISPRTQSRNAFTANVQGPFLVPIRTIAPELILFMDHS